MTRSLLKFVITRDADLIVVAVPRGGEEAGPGTIELRAGDLVLLHGT